MLTEERQQQVIKLCQELLQRPSYSGEEGQLAEKIKEACGLLVFDNVYIDEYGNIIGHIKGNRPGKSLLFDGHIDTVPVPDPNKWTHNPYGGELEDGKIFGRGASDMKGSVAAMLCAASYFGQDTKKDFAGEIYVAGVVYEEIFEGIAARKISEKFKPDYVVIGEASELNLKIGQRGRAEIVVETYGKPAHSANPHKGINAVYKMAKLIDRIRQLETSKHETLGLGILELTDIKSSPYPGASVVPDYCRVTYDRRLLVGETKVEVLRPILEVIAEMELEDPEFSGKAYYAVGKETCYTGAIIEGERFFPGWVFDEQADFIQKALGGLKKADLEPEISHYSFCTNGSHYAGEKGIKTIGFGPSWESLAHTIDEYIEVDQLLKATQGYLEIIKALLS